MDSLQAKQATWISKITVTWFHAALTEMNVLVKATVTDCSRYHLA